ncbi:peptidoglycan-binding protein [Kitasatospora sp. NPDC004272]
MEQVEQVEQDGTAGATGSGAKRRRRLIVAVALVAALIAGGGLWASTLVRSPEQAAADAAPPPASVLTAPVVQRVLSNTTVLRGVFQAGQSFPVQPATVSASSGGPGGGTPVVTALKARAGDEVRQAEVLAEVSGRPVFVLPGDVPVYRDLAPGESGSDVAQLQNALKALGYSSGGDARGSFGAGTKAAVTKLYQHLGYPVPNTGEQTAAAVRTAQQAVDQAKQTLQGLEHPGPTATTDGKPASPAADGSAQLARARADLADRQRELTQAQAKDGPQVPASELLFLPSLPARVSGVGAKVGDKVTAPVLTLTAGGLTLTGHLLPGDAPLVKAGMKVTVLSETSGLQLSATVGSVGTLVTPGSGQAGGASAPAQQPAAPAGDPYVPVTVTPDQPWDPALEGQDVRITVVAASTQGEVLAVPASAVSSGVDGRTSVTVLEPGGARRTVEVATGVVADNFVEVRPATGAALNPGDQVVVGK